MITVRSTRVIFRTVSGKEYVQRYVFPEPKTYHTREFALQTITEDIQSQLAIGKWITLEDIDVLDRNDRIWSKNIESFWVSLVEEVPNALKEI